MFSAVWKAPAGSYPFQPRLLAMLVAVAMLSGCSGQPEVKLDDYLDELEFNTPLESVQEVEIGYYRISCAARHQDRSGRETLPVWVQVKFTLFAETSDRDENSILAACERHRGMLDDAIITVIRKASIDEFSDNRWAAIKSKLIDTIRPLLGGYRVRQIFFDDFSWEPI
jgi:hypothetical protein